MKSNASLLCLLTISDSSEEKVFFVYLKELEEIAPASQYWYKKRGKDGHADTIWKNKKLKQWCVIGTDNEIQAIFSELINNNKYTQEWSSDLKINFTIGNSQKKEVSNNFMLIDSVCSCDRNEYPIEYTCESWLPDIGFLINEKNNCNYIEGYQKNEAITPVNPHGLFCTSSNQFELS